MKNSSKSGFSLIETIIAIAILVMVITGPLALSSQSLKAASAAKNNFIVANLAQEGIELIRLYRTNNVLQGRSSWLSDLSAVCQTTNCYVDAKNFYGDNSNFILTQCGGACPVLKIDANGFYNYTVGTNTIFTRTIRLTSISADIERIKVTITWNSNTGGQSLVVEEIMHNWLTL
ncbi:MAG: prepilin-type N-terminal cleavage/methylation domain-containing protein [bacterium]|nr:prepilin-type N-terminal cleavage/methylation domain-containing protein [bacterium]